MIVLVTGGGAGIGAGLAAAFSGRGAKVIIAGPTREKLEAVASRHPGMEVEVLDVSDVAAVEDCAARIAARHPALDLVINNAGVQQLLDFGGPEPLPAATLLREIDVNLRGLVAVTNAFLPALRRRPRARLVNVSSGLAFVPLVAAPVYSATKAAVHAFTVSLRAQLAGGPVQVVELIPPVVDTELHRNLERTPPRAMSCEAFVKAALAGLDAGHDEITVGLARLLRVGARVAPSAFLRLVNPPRR